MNSRFILWLKLPRDKHAIFMLIHSSISASNMATENTKQFQASFRISTNTVSQPVKSSKIFHAICLLSRSKYCRQHQSPPMDTFLSHFHPLPILTTSFNKIHINVVFPSTSRPLKVNVLDTVSPQTCLSTYFLPLQAAPTADRSLLCFIILVVIIDIQLIMDSLCNTLTSPCLNRHPDDGSRQRL